MIFKHFFIYIFFSSILFSAQLNKVAIYANIGDFGAIKKEIANGAKIDESDGLYKQTPLLFAVFNNHQDIAKYLIEQGVNINALSENGRGVLAYAMSNNELEFFKYLKQKGAKANYDVLVFDAIKDKKTAFLNEIFEDKTIALDKTIATYAMSYAIINSDNELFNKVLAKVDIKAWFGYKIFDNSKYIDSLDELKQEAQKKEFNFLHLAARYGTNEMIQILLTNDLYIESLSNIDGKFKFSPIAISAFYKNYDTFIALYNAGANIYKIFKSTNEGNFGLAYMLGAGAEYTTLDLSVVGEPAKVDYRIVDFLLLRKDFTKFVPLESENFYINFYMFAASNKNSIYAKVLNALDNAGYIKSFNLQKSLDAAHKKVSQNEKQDLSISAIDKIYYLLQKCDNTKLLFSQIKYFGVDLNKTNGNKPILFEAMDKCSSDTLIELVKLGADPLVKYKSDSILEYAFSQRYLDTKFIRYLSENYKELNSAFANQKTFNKFLYAAYDEMDLYNKFMQNGLKPEFELVLYFYSSKSQQLAFTILDANKERLNIKNLTYLIDTEQRYSKNSTHINAYAYKNGIAMDEDFLFLNSIMAEKYSFASDAILFGADKNYKINGRDACSYVQKQKRVKQFIIDKLCN